MNPLDLFDAIFGPVNPISRLLGVLSATINGSYKSAAKRNGVIGVVSEASKNVAGANSYRFAFSRKGAQTLEGIHELLGKYGVHTFSYLHDHENFYFNVRRSQAGWAEYVLLRAGVELQGGLFDSRNAVYRNYHAPGSMPMPWSEKDRLGPIAIPSFSSSILNVLFGSDRKSSMNPPPRAKDRPKHENRFDHATLSGGLQQKASHHNSVPARKPGGWLDQLDTFIGEMLGE